MNFLTEPVKVHCETTPSFEFVETVVVVFNVVVVVVVMVLLVFVDDAA